MILRIASWAIILGLILTMLFSCAKSGAGEETAAITEAVTEENDPLAERRAISDDLPATDLEGLEWRVYAQEVHVKGFFYTDAEDGEVVNDAIYYANRTVEERFNVDLVVDYSGNDDTGQPAAIQRLVAAGDSSYSLVTCHDVLGSNLSLNGTFVNLYKINYLNFDKPWWHDMEAITVLGQVYMISSDMSVLQLSRTWSVYFNKDIMDDFTLEYPYQTVLDGTWTLDKLISLTRDVYVDVNGDSTRDNGDVYGFSILPNCYGWLDSMGIQTTMKDKDDILKVNEDQTKITSLVEKMYDWLFNTAGGRSSMQNNVTEDEMFKNQQLMMIYSMITSSVNNYRFVEKLNYGILPVPKYDEKQADYISTFMDYPFFVPNTQSDEQLNVTGLMIEALSAEGYKQIFPAYYEIALKVKYAQDDESVQMIEIINRTTRPSFSWCFENWQGLQQSLYTLILGKSSDYASYYAKTVKSAQARVNTLIKLFEKMELD